MFERLMPERLAPWAAEVDWVNEVISDIALFFLVLLTGVMLYFAIRYRRRPGHQQAFSTVHHNTALEIFWTAVPTVVVLFIFYFGMDVYREMRTSPANALEIGVRGFQWYWEFTYPTGKKTTRDLVVPVDEPVRLIMRSGGENPVNHSFFIPSMRMKEDVIGSAYHFLWFQAERTGLFPVFCAEYCGTSHSDMTARLHVVTRAEYDDFVNDRKKEELPPEILGKQIYENRGCKACHTIDGSRLVGPTFKGLFGKQEQLSDGSTVTVDENYIHQSILEPGAKVVIGYPPAMAPQSLSDEEIMGVIAYLKSLAK